MFKIERIKVAKAYLGKMDGEIIVESCEVHGCHKITGKNYDRKERLHGD